MRVKLPSKSFGGSKSHSDEKNGEMVIPNSSEKKQLNYVRNNFE